MSLFNDGSCDFPSMSDYQRRELIPEAERCTSCEGLGTIRWRHSMTGQGDYRNCFICLGSGRKP
jgi:hypothetical protein